MKQFSKELGKVSITPKGDWNSSIANEKLDIVYDRRNNQAYIAKQDVPIGVDIDNREYWQPLNATGYADNNFINLTAENENGTITAYESLEEAVATIFPINRRVGATLSFYNLNSDRLDRQAEFELWQFNSTDLANWENRDYWNNIYYNWNVFAGWYIDADALKNHVETPNVGQYAYVGSNLNDAILYQCRTNGTWTNTGIKVRNYISVVVSGNITIGENGNWFSDGEDTGIPATPAVDEQLDNIITKHESLSRTVQGIAVTGGASTAINVTYNNDSSGLNAENAQDAIDELNRKKIDKTSIDNKTGNDNTKVMSQYITSFELNKKFDKVNIVQTTGDAEDKVMSQNAINNIRRFMLSTCNLGTYCYLHSKDKTDIRPTFMHKGKFNETIGLSNLLIIPKPSYDLEISGGINSNAYTHAIVPALLFIDRNFNIIDFIFSESETFTISQSDIPADAVYMCLHQSNTEPLYINYSSRISCSLDTGINLESVLSLKELIKNNASISINQNYGYDANLLISQAEITKRSKVPSNLKCYFNLDEHNKPVDITIYKLTNTSIGLTNLIAVPKIDMTLYGLANLDLYKNVIPSAKSIMFLDRNFNIINSLYVTESDFDDLNNRIYTLKSESIDDNAVFMMLYIETGRILKIQDNNSVLYTTYDTGINFYEVYYLKNQIDALQNKILTNNKYINKNCVILGDSITNLGGDDCSGEKGWTTYFKNIMNFKSVKSYARSGATWTNTANTKYNITENTGSLSDDNNVYNQINRLIDAISKGTQVVPDYIFIALGTNDTWYRYDSAIKDYENFEAIWNDVTNYSNEVDIKSCTSIIKSIRFVYDMIINSELKNSQVIILTPLQGTFSTVSKINEIGDIIERCANVCSWNVIRQDYECGINRLQELKSKTNTSDGTHPSVAGAKIVGKYLASRVTTMLRTK